jgi:hypothetical protein
VQEERECTITESVIITSDEDKDCDNDCNPDSFVPICSSIYPDMVDRCMQVGTCWKIDRLYCKNGCQNGQCVEIETPQQQALISPQVIVTTSSIAIAAGLGLSWLWFLLLLVPFFLKRLRHYLAATFDFDDSLGLVKISGNKSLVEKKKLDEFVELLEKKYGKMTFAGMKNDSARFLVERGFIEIQLTHPVVINGHFSNAKDESRFKKILREILNHELTVKEAKKMKIIESVERASIFSLIREMKREKKTMKQIKKLGVKK